VTVFVDTSALYTLLDREEARHAAAEAAFVAALGKREVFVSHNYIVTETSALAQRRLGARAAIDLLGRLVPLLDIVWVDQEVHEVAAAAFTASASRSVSLVDRVSFEVMRLHGIDAAFAFDADFVAAGFHTIP
jgi:predicted nucleic acid-binding protein